MSDGHYDESDAGVEWGTPPEYVRPLADAVGGFDLDPAAGAEPEPYAEDRYTKADDGLALAWYGDVWLNPPYGRTENPRWARKAFNEYDSGRADTLTALIPVSADTGWFQDYYAKADYLTLIRGRVSFIGGENNATFPSGIASYGDFPPAYFDALDEMGTVLTGADL